MWCRASREKNIFEEEEYFGVYSVLVNYGHHVNILYTALFWSAKKFALQPATLEGICATLNLRR